MTAFSLYIFFSLGMYPLIWCLRTEASNQCVFLIQGFGGEKCICNFALII